MKGKPIKWGVKVFLLCGESGAIYNILPFQGYYIAYGKVDRVTSWDKKEKQSEEIGRPEIVRLYNKSMARVGKMDQLVSYYRILIRSRKWTLRMIMYAFNTAISYCWIQY